MSKKKNKKILGGILAVFILAGAAILPHQSESSKSTQETAGVQSENSGHQADINVQQTPTPQPVQSEEADIESAAAATDSGQETVLQTLPTEDVSVQTAPSAQVILSVADIPPYSGSPYTVINNNVPAFLETDLSTGSYEYYSELDSLGRCGAAYACIGRDLMPTEERGSIGQVKPSGWHTVKYDHVDGKYLYNRCHLIGYQLSGENANVKNLITGTRYLNVDGMLPFENMVADYVKETGNHVMYRVSPLFEGNNLLASGVEMEAMSVEDHGAGILFHVYCYNVQPGIVIDYATGDSSSETSAAQPESGQQNAGSTESEPVQPQQVEQVQDNNTGVTVHVTDTGGKYHNAGCQYLKKSDHEISLSDAKNRGLEPCSKCHPPQ